MNDLENIRNPPTEPELCENPSLLCPRTFAAVCYAESSNILAVKEWIIDHSLQYAYVLHDADVSDDGTPKKPHYHIYIHVPSSITPPRRKGLFDVLGTKHLETVKRPRKYLRYLVHLDDADKHQYSPLDVVNNIPQVFAEALADADETQSLLDDVDKLNDGALTYREFLSLHPKYLRNPRAVGELKAMCAGFESTTERNNYLQRQVSILDEEIASLKSLLASERYLKEQLRASLARVARAFYSNPDNSIRFAVLGDPFILQALKDFMPDDYKKES